MADIQYIVKYQKAEYYTGELFDDVWGDKVFKANYRKRCDLNMEFLKIEPPPPPPPKCYKDCCVCYKKLSCSTGETCHKCKAYICEECVCEYLLANPHFESHLEDDDYTTCNYYNCPLCRTRLSHFI